MSKFRSRTDRIIEACKEAAGEDLVEGVVVVAECEVDGTLVTEGAGGVLVEYEAECEVDRTPVTEGVLTECEVNSTNLFLIPTKHRAFNTIVCPDQNAWDATNDQIMTIPENSDDIQNTIAVSPNPEINNASVELTSDNTVVENLHLSVIDQDLPNLSNLSHELTLFEEDNNQFEENADNDIDNDPTFVPKSSDESSADSQSNNEIDEEGTKENESPNIQKRWSIKHRNDRKRNNGQEYLTYNGKVKRARAIQSLKDCRMGCKKKIDENDRKLLFDEYWSLAVYDKRVAYCASLINTSPKATERKATDGEKKRKHRAVTHSYHLEFKGKRITVCKSCFLRTLDETEKFLVTVINKKSLTAGGSTYSDKRGKHPPPHKTAEYKLKEIRNHIYSFPAYESHYTRRHSEKKYFAPNLNISTLYRLYCEKFGNPVSLKIFSAEFQKTGIKFKKPKLDTCTKCDVLNMEINAANKEKSSQAKEALQQHQEAADLAYAKKQEDKDLGKTDPSYLTFTFDLQQVLPTPHITADKAFYLRQLSTYNLTVHDGVSGNSSHFMWHEAVGGRGANDIASCLYRHIQNLPEGATNVVYYSDTCGGQNKNSFVSAMFQYALTSHPTLKTIDHKFLVAGHTHMECDVDHAAIERRKKHSPFPIHLPRDWYNLVRTTGKKNKFEVFVMENEHFFNFSSLFKGALQTKHVNTEKEKFTWNSIQWLRYQKGEFGLVKYKTSLKDTKSFKAINYLRRGRKCNGVIPPPPKLYDGPLSISAKKKKNLLELLPLINEDDRPFYIQLKTDEELGDTNLDLDRDFSDEELE